MQPNPVSTTLKLISSLCQYLITPISYGVFFAVAVLIIIPKINHNFLPLSILQSTAQQQQPISYAKAVSIAGPAVVNIYSTELQNPPIYGRKAIKSTRLGSGVIMDSLGYILTNYHVVHNTDLIKVLLQSGQTYSAELIGFDIYTDLAVLRVDALNLPVIPQRTDLTSLPGDVVLAIGNPLNLGQTVTQGIISATGRISLSTTSYLNFLQMDAAINDGNSGGALINTHGELVGINSRRVTDDKLNIQGIFLAVPYQLAAKVMQKIIAHGRVVRGWLGIEADTQHEGIEGFIIKSISPNSPAMEAGLLEGDIIYQIGEHKIVSISQALELVAETVPNTTLVFKIYRKKEPFDIPVTIIEMKK